MPTGEDTEKKEHQLVHDGLERGLQRGPWEQWESRGVSTPLISQSPGAGAETAPPKCPREIPQRRGQQAAEQNLVPETLDPNIEPKPGKGDSSCSNCEGLHQRTQSIAWDQDGRAKASRTAFPKRVPLSCFRHLFPNFCCFVMRCYLPAFSVRATGRGVLGGGQGLYV